MSLKAAALHYFSRKLDRKLSGNVEETFTPEKQPKVSYENREFPQKTVNFEKGQSQAETARKISCILSGLYKQRTDSEWEWLRIKRPEWFAKRAALENELDGCFLAGDLEAGQETFYRLEAHLKAAPIDPLSSKVAKQLDMVNHSQPQTPSRRTWRPKKLPGHPEAWDGSRISGQEYYNLPPVKKQRHKK